MKKLFALILIPVGVLFVALSGAQALDPGTIEISQPEAGAVYAPGDTMTIRWTNPGISVASLELVLCFPGNAQTAESCNFETSIAGFANFGYTDAMHTYTWTIPAGTKPFDTYRIKLYNGYANEVEYSQRIYYLGQSGLFEISSQEAPVSRLNGIIAPQAGETLVAGRPYTFKWSQQAVRDVMLTFKLDSEVQYVNHTIAGQLFQDPGSKEGAYTWTPPEDLLSGTYTFTVDATHEGKKTQKVFVDSKYDSVSDLLNRSTIPVDAGSLPEYVVGKEYRVSWEATCPNPRVKIWFSKLFGEEEQIYQLSPLIESASKKGSYMVRIPEFMQSSQFSFNTRQGVSYITFRNLDGSTKDRVSTQPLFDPVVPGSYRFRVSVTSSDGCKEEGLSRSIFVVQTASASNVQQKSPDASNTYEQPKPTSVDTNPGKINSGAQQAKTAPSAELLAVRERIKRFGYTASQRERQVNEREKGRVARVDTAFRDKLKGRILLQVQEGGEAWYVDHTTGLRFYLKDGETALTALRVFGLGVTNADLKTIPVGIEERAEMADADGDGLADQLEDAIGTDKLSADSDGDGYTDGSEVKNGYNPAGSGKTISGSLKDKLEGKILLQVEGKGEAWYVRGGKRFYMKNGDQAYHIMRFLSLGITNADLARIAVGEFEE